MAGALQNVVVIGGAGNLGPAIVKELLAANISVTATTRKESKSTFPDGVDVVKTDYSDESLAQIFSGKDAVVSLIAGAALGEQNRYIDAAVKSRVKRFFPSEFGSDTTNTKVAADIPFFKGKVDTVEYLRSKEKDGLSWTALVTGGFFDWGLQNGFFDFDLKKKAVNIWDSGNNQFSTTNLATIGKAIANILTKPDVLEATKNQYVNISSHTTSQNEILAALEHITGDKWTKSNVSAAEKAKEGKEGFANGNFYAIFQVLKSYVFGDGAPANARDYPGGLWDDKLGLAKEDLKEDLKRILASS